MTIDPKLLHILRCPITKQRLKVLKPEELDQINQLIEQGNLQQLDETPLKQALHEALITENRQTIYQIIDGIPIMLEERSIPTQQIESWSKP